MDRDELGGYRVDRLSPGELQETRKLKTQAWGHQRLRIKTCNGVVSEITGGWSTIRNGIEEALEGAQHCDDLPASQGHQDKKTWLLSI